MNHFRPLQPFAATISARRSWIVVLFVGFAACPFLAIGQSNEFLIRKTTLVTDTGMPTNIVPRGSRWNFGPGALQTYRGWQYAAFWDASRQVTVARRKLPNGQWQAVSLSGYQRTSNVNRGNGGVISRGFGDGHEKVAMGISSDGVIHLAFDHHLSPLHYRSSQTGIANAPDQFEWSEDLFTVVQDYLGGESNQRGPTIDTVTYPSFVRDGNRLSLYLRLGGGSGNADSHFFEYQNGHWTINDPIKSKIIDRQWSGGDGTVNAYPNTMMVHRGRQHLTWCWRDTPNARTCHDLCYAYSDDHGQTWKNNAGKTVARRGKEFITADSPGIAVLEIPSGSSYVNGGSMTVNERGDVYVLMKGPNHRPLTAQRDALTGIWKRGESPTVGSLLASESDLFVVSENGIYQSIDGKPSTLSMVSESIESESDDSKFIVDRQRWRHDQTISVIGQNGTDVRVIDFLPAEP